MLDLLSEHKQVGMLSVTPAALVVPPRPVLGPPSILGVQVDRAALELEVELEVEVAPVPVVQDKQVGVRTLAVGLAVVALPQDRPRRVRLVVSPTAVLEGKPKTTRLVALPDRAGLPTAEADRTDQAVVAGMGGQERTTAAPAVSASNGTPHMERVEEAVVVAPAVLVTADSVEVMVAVVAVEVPLGSVRDRTALAGLRSSSSPTPRSSAMPRPWLAMPRSLTISSFKGMLSRLFKERVWSLMP